MPPPPGRPAAGPAPGGEIIVARGQVVTRCRNPVELSEIALKVTNYS
jgi:hypothetical protein